MRRWTCRCSPGLTVLGGAAALLVLAGGFLWMLGGTAPIASSTIGGPFTLVDGSGERVTDQSFRGRFLLIYFGYASCPDVCPTALGNVETAMQQLGPKATRVQPLFITIDPRHDTPAVVASYVRGFGPDLIGLTGSAEDVRAAERAYHIRSAPHDRVIDHTSVLLLIGPDGRYLAPIPADASPADIARRVSQALG